MKAEVTSFVISNVDKMLLDSAKWKIKHSETKRKQMGLQYNDIILRANGLTLRADGAEGCFVSVQTDNSPPVILDHAGLVSLMRALPLAMDWCDYGEPPGIC